MKQRPAPQPFGLGPATNQMEVFAQHLEQLRNVRGLTIAYRDSLVRRACARGSYYVAAAVACPACLEDDHKELHSLAAQLAEAEMDCATRRAALLSVEIEQADQQIAELEKMLQSAGFKSGN